jgi:hypothetical protein
MPFFWTNLPLFRPRNSLWLIVLPILACVLDVSLTLQGQSEEYWRGHYDQVHEWTPPARLLLEFHPLAFLAGILAWIAGFSVFILFSPRRWSLDGCLLFTFGHTLGACSWLRHMEANGLWYCAVAVLAIGVLAVPVWRLRRNA